MGLRLVPLPTLARWFGVPVRADRDERPGTAPLAPTERRRIAVIRAVARRWPLGPGPCLRSALVEGRALRRRQPVLRLGVAGGRSGGPLVAHAWVEVDGRPLEAQAGFLPLTRPGP